MAKLNIKAVINLQGLVDICTKVPEMLDVEPTFDLVCNYDGGSLGCCTIEEVMEIVRALIKREKEEVLKRLADVEQRRTA